MHNDLSDNEIILETKKSIKSNSPFKYHFEKLFISTKLKIDTLEEEAEKKDDYILNDYYFPELYKLIHNELPLIPLWSGIVIFRVQQQFPTYFKEVLSRLTNNFVENWFGHLKNDILFGRELLTSELSSKLYKRIVSKYIEFYSNNSKNKTQSGIDFNFNSF